MLNEMQNLEEGRAYLNPTPRSVIAGSGRVPANEVASGARDGPNFSPPDWPCLTWLTKGMESFSKTKKH